MTSHPWGMPCMPPRCTLTQTRVYMKHGRIVKRFSGDRPFPCALSFALFRLPIWRVLERRGVAEPLVSSSTRHSAKVIFLRCHIVEKAFFYAIIYLLI